MNQNQLRLSLPQDLKDFVRQNSGEGTLFTTTGEFIRSVLREKKERLEAERIRDAILAGYQDVVEGQTVRFDGNVRRLLRTVTD